MGGWLSEWLDGWGVQEPHPIQADLCEQASSAGPTCLDHGGALHRIPYTYTPPNILQPATNPGPLITRPEWHPIYPLNFPLPKEKWGGMGENGGKWGKMGKPGENIGKLVEEDGKNIQLSTKMAKIFQTCYSPFSSMFPHFPPGMLLTTSPPTPPSQQKVVWGFSRNIVPIFQQNIR